MDGVEEVDGSDHDEEKAELLVVHQVQSAQQEGVEQNRESGQERHHRRFEALWNVCFLAENLHGYDNHEPAPGFKPHKPSFIQTFHFPSLFKPSFFLPLKQ